MELIGDGGIEKLLWSIDKDGAVQGSGSDHKINLRGQLFWTSLDYRGSIQTAGRGALTKIDGTKLSPHNRVSQGSQANASQR